MTAVNEQPESWSAGHELSVDQMARQQGLKPIASVDELAQPDLFESDEEYEALLADLYPSRRSDVA